MPLYFLEIGKVLASLTEKETYVEHKEKRSRSLGYRYKKKDVKQGLLPLVML